MRLFKSNNILDIIDDDKVSIDKSFRDKLKMDFTGSTGDSNTGWAFSVFGGAKYATGLAVIAVLVVAGVINYGGSNDVAHLDGGANNVDTVGIENASLNEVSGQTEIIDPNTSTTVENTSESANQTPGQTEAVDSSSVENQTLESQSSTNDIDTKDLHDNEIEDDNVINTDNLISSVQAIAVAQAEFSDKVVTSVNLEHDGDIYVYEVKLADESEVVVDAQTGVVLKTEDKATN